MVGRNMEMLEEFLFVCLRHSFLLVCFTPLGCCAIQCNKQHSMTRIQYKEKLWKERQHCELAAGVLFHCTLVLQFGARFWISTKVDWLSRDLVFPVSLLFIQFSGDESCHHCSTPWLSLNPRAQWLHQRAIFQRSPGINLAREALGDGPGLPWKVLWLTASMISRHRRLSDSYLKRETEREVTPLLRFNVERSPQRTIALLIPLQSKLHIK